MTAPMAETLPKAQGDWRPVPDPTTLTTAQLTGAILTLRELMESEISSVKAEFLARFNGMDKAITLIQAEADKVPSKTDIAVGNLKELHAERFNGVQVQFTERDDRLKQTAQDSKLAIDAALQAAKEAVGKTEAAFTKSIDQLTALLQTNTKSLDDKILATQKALTDKFDAGNKALDDKILVISLRQERGEGRGSGQATLIGATGVFLGLLLAAAGIIIPLAARG